MPFVHTARGIFFLMILRIDRLPMELPRPPSPNATGVSAAQEMLTKSHDLPFHS